MTAYTSTQSGNFNVNSTWGGGGHPTTTSDTASIGHTVTNAVGVTDTCGAIAVTAGALVVNGHFDMGGAITLSASTALNMGAGSTLDHHGFNVVVAGSGIQYNFAGSSGSHVTIQSTGGRGAFTNGGANVVTPTWDYADVSGLAPSSFGRGHGTGIKEHMQHCTFTDMDAWYLDETTVNTNWGFEFDFNDIRSPHNGAAQCQIVANSQALGSNPRSFTNNTVDGGSNLTAISWNFVDGSTVTFSDNVLKRCQLTSANGAMNVAGCALIGLVDETSCFGTDSAFSAITSCYLYLDLNPEHAFNGCAPGIVSGNVLEMAGGIGGVGQNWFSRCLGTQVYKFNVCLGVGYGNLWACAETNASDLDFYNNTFHVDNHGLLQWTIPNNGDFAPILAAEVSGLLTGTVRVFNNVHFDIDLNVTRQDEIISLVDTTPDQVDLADYNCAYPLLPQYSAQLHISGGFGAHDIAENPRFVDDQRALATWDTSLGGPGTETNAIAELLKRNGTGGTWNPAYNVADLVSWVRAGFVPTNAALQGTAMSGADFGALPAAPVSTVFTAVGRGSRAIKFQGALISA